MFLNNSIQQINGNIPTYDIGFLESLNHHGSIVSMYKNMDGVITPEQIYSVTDRLYGETMPPDIKYGAVVEDRNKIMFLALANKEIFKIFNLKMSTGYIPKNYKITMDIQDETMAEKTTIGVPVRNVWTRQKSFMQSIEMLGIGSEDTDLNLTTKHGIELWKTKQAAMFRSVTKRLIHDLIETLYTWRSPLMSELNLKADPTSIINSYFREKHRNFNTIASVSSGINFMIKNMIRTNKYLTHLLLSPQISAYVERKKENTVYSINGGSTLDVKNQYDKYPKDVSSAGNTGPNGMVINGLKVFFVEKEVLQGNNKNTKHDVMRVDGKELLEWYPACYHGSKDSHGNWAPNDMNIPFNKKEVDVHIYDQNIDGLSDITTEELLKKSVLFDQNGDLKGLDARINPWNKYARYDPFIKKNYSRIDFIGEMKDLYHKQLEFQAKNLLDQAKKEFYISNNAERIINNGIMNIYKEYMNLDVIESDSIPLAYSFVGYKDKYVECCGKKNYLTISLNTLKKAFSKHKKIFTGIGNYHCIKMISEVLGKDSKCTEFVEMFKKLSTFIKSIMPSNKMINKSRLPKIPGAYYKKNDSILFSNCVDNPVHYIWLGEKSLECFLFYKSLELTNWKRKKHLDAYMKYLEFTEETKIIQVIRIIKEILSTEIEIETDSGTDKVQEMDMGKLLETLKDNFGQNINDKVNNMFDSYIYGKAFIFVLIIRIVKLYMKKSLGMKDVAIGSDENSFKQVLSDLFNIDIKNNNLFGTSSIDINYNELKIEVNALYEEIEKILMSRYNGTLKHVNGNIVLKGNFDVLHKNVGKRLDYKRCYSRNTVNNVTTIKFKKNGVVEKLSSNLGAFAYSDILDEKKILLPFTYTLKQIKKICKEYDCELEWENFLGNDGGKKRLINFSQKYDSQEMIPEKFYKEFDKKYFDVDENLDFENPTKYYINDVKDKTRHQVFTVFDREIELSENILNKMIEIRKSSSIIHTALEKFISFIEFKRDNLLTMNENNILIPFEHILFRTFRYNSYISMGVVQGKTALVVAGSFGIKEDHSNELNKIQRKLLALAGTLVLDPRNIVVEEDGLVEILDDGAGSKVVDLSGNGHKSFNFATNKLGGNGESIIAVPVPIGFFNSLNSSYIDITGIRRELKFNNVLGKNKNYDEPMYPTVTRIMSALNVNIDSIGGDGGRVPGKKWKNTSGLLGYCRYLKKNTFGPGEEVVDIMPISPISKEMCKPGVAKSRKLFENKF